MNTSNNFYVFFLISFSCHLILSYVAIFFTSQQPQLHNKIISLELVQMNKVTNKTTSNAQKATNNKQTTFQLKQNNLRKPNIKHNARNNLTNYNSISNKIKPITTPAPSPTLPITTKVTEPPLKIDSIEQKASTSHVPEKIASAPQATPKVIEQTLQSPPIEHKANVATTTESSASTTQPITPKVTEPPLKIDSIEQKASTSHVPEKIASAPQATQKVIEQTLQSSPIEHKTNVATTTESNASTTLPITPKVTEPPLKSSHIEDKTSVAHTTDTSHSITQKNNLATSNIAAEQQHIANNHASRQNTNNTDNTNSTSYTDTIKYQIQAHWNHTIGFIPGISTVLMVTLTLDGTIENITDISHNCPNNNTTVCNIFIQNVKRAIWAASPFQELPKEEYNAWQQLVLEFNPED
ncbi:hypothetical protein [Orientia tsutsugamushi]|uniref:hypothetical protein n=1 Tax=Orientia tsutsugamushi TaxID=784 RepID=UPI00123950FA|nr:hypothetical protein [Orientia tsutsugamushi]QES95756.1 hypothetical protein F0363_01840 [Orientia tsutsugamushi]